VNATLKKTTGNWVDGDRFWNRQTEMALFIESLEDGANILLIAPRRIGKTSLMHEASRCLQDRFICLHVDLQKAQSPEDAVAELSLATRPYETVFAKTKGLFKNILGKVESVGFSELSLKLRSDLNAGNWQEKGDRLFEILAQADKPVVIFMDEVPILVSRIMMGDEQKVTPERKKQTDHFMSWLRSNALKHQDKIRQVVTGSIGLATVLRVAGLSATMNHYHPFELKPWSDEVAIECLRALAREYNLQWQEGAAEKVVTLLGYNIAHHVQLFFEKIYQQCKRDQITSISSEMVQDVFDTDMLGARGHVELSHMEERLRLVLSSQFHTFAVECLTEAAVANQLTAKAMDILARDCDLSSTTPGEARREILEIMEHDGYLRRRGDAYVFVSNLLKLWWRNRFGFGFKTALERVV